MIYRVIGLKHSDSCPDVELVTDVLEQAHYHADNRIEIDDYFDAYVIDKHNKIVVD